MQDICIIIWNKYVSANHFSLGGDTIPANLTPEFKIARENFHKASTPKERLIALNEMLRTIPKHKGTEKMVADLRKRIARFKEQSEQQTKSGRQQPFWIIERQGAGRLVMLGPANSGKSSFMQATTNATPEVAPYPHTTQQPTPGMLPYLNIQYQLIDMPPFVIGHPGWMLELVRTADILVLMEDLSSDDILTTIETTLQLLKAANLSIVHPLSYANNEDEEVSEIDEDELFVDPNTRKTIIVANKLDAPGALERLHLLQEVCQIECPDIPIHSVSCQENTNLDQLKADLFHYLDIVRIYTKAPGQKPSYAEPVVVPRGTPLIEAAGLIHKDFAEKLKYARVWGSSIFDGQRVSSQYILEDEDVVEFHI